MINAKIPAKVNNKTFFIFPPYSDAGLSQGRTSNQGRSKIKAQSVPAWFINSRSIIRKNLPSGLERMSNTFLQIDIFPLMIRNNEAPRRKRRGIKRNCAIAYPPLLFELRRGSPRHSSLRQAAGYSGEGE